MLAEYGANIVVLDIAQPDAALERTKPDYGVEIEYYMVYVANREQVNQVIEKMQEFFSSANTEYVLYLPVPLFQRYYRMSALTSMLQDF